MFCVKCHLKWQRNSANFLVRILINSDYDNHISFSGRESPCLSRKQHFTEISQEGKKKDITGIQHGYYSVEKDDI